MPAEASPATKVAPASEFLSSAETGAPGYHAMPAAAALAALDVSPETGLDEAEVARRTDAYGSNTLAAHHRKSPWRVLAEQFTSLLVGLLLAAAVLSFYLGDTVEALAILIVVAVNAAIGFFTEERAIRSMEALRTLSAGQTRVRRSGRECTVMSDGLVPGDIVLLEAGDVVSADLRIVEAHNLECNEAALTGESLPVGKTAKPVSEDTILAERVCMAYRGTHITRGLGIGLVVASGMGTELGRISSLASAAEKDSTPLQRRLEVLSRQLVWLTLGVAVVIVVAGLIHGQPLFLMITTGIALAVAAVPEGLPIVATMALARGMWRMADLNVLVERLPAVETLGATTVICTDKTGTLTEDRMTVGHIATREARYDASDPSGPETASGAIDAVLEIGVLCNDARLAGDRAEQAHGDPMELALLAAAHLHGLDHHTVLSAYPRVQDHAFDVNIKAMATVHEAGEGRYLYAVKGAAESVLSMCTHEVGASGETPLEDTSRARWTGMTDELASQGVRVLGLARKVSTDPDEPPYEGLSIVGLVGFLDPPRADVHDAIAACREAGIRVVMLTGDHVATAHAIARQVGLVDDEDGWAPVLEGKVLADPEGLTGDRLAVVLDAPVFARVTPEQKLNLVSLFQKQGEIAAMTGDGVNDAPALRKADIGVAMGIRGTQVAREAADMILRDDAFTSIVAAVREGRTIFANIRKAIVYLLSCNLSEILIVGLATAGGLPLPLTPLQILFLNIVTDVFPAFALAASEGDSRNMQRPPRDPSEDMLAPRHWRTIGIFGVILSAATLGAFGAALEIFHMPAEEATTIAFLTLAFGQLFHVFNMRAPTAGLVFNEVSRNRYVWGALAICTAIILAALHLGHVREALSMIVPSLTDWMLILGAASAPVLLSLAYLPFAVWRRRHRTDGVI